MQTGERACLQGGTVLLHPVDPRLSPLRIQLAEGLHEAQRNYDQNCLRTLISRTATWCGHGPKRPDLTPEDNAMELTLRLWMPGPRCLLPIWFGDTLGKPPDHGALAAKCGHESTERWHVDLTEPYLGERRGEVVVAASGHAGQRAEGVGEVCVVLVHRRQQCHGHVAVVLLQALSQRKQAASCVRRHAPCRGNLQSSSPKCQALAALSQ